MTCIKCGHDPEAVVVASWSFFVDRAVESLNAHRVNSGAGRHVYRRERAAWQWEIRAAKLRERIPAATELRRVTLTRLYGKGCRAFDADNLIGGMKLVVDGLVREGLIVGDSLAQAEIYYEQVRSTAAAGLSVLLEELA